MNIFLDTNIFLRFFIGDNPDQLEIVKRIFNLNEEGNIKVSTSGFVLSEFIYVESSFYKIKKADTIVDVETILKLRNLWLIDKTNFLSSFKLYKSSMSKSYKLSDCIIINQVSRSYKLCSFDERLMKLIGEKRFIHPNEVVKFSQN